MSLPLSPTSAHSFAGRPTRSRSALRDAEIVELAHGVGLQIDADAERAHLAHRFEDDAGHADLVQRQGRRQPANAAAGDDHKIVRHTPRHHAARHRLLHAGGLRKRDRQAVERAHRQISEGLRFDRLRRPADRVGGFHARRLEPLGQHAHQGRIARAAARHDPGARRRRQMPHDARHRRRRQRRQRRRAVHHGKIRQPDIGEGEGIAIERLRARQIEKAVGQHALDESSRRPCPFAA